MKLSKVLIAAFTALPLLLASGCGDDDGGSLESVVVGLFLENSTLVVGDATVATVQFSYDAGELFDEGGTIALYLRLPPGVAFVEGSSEIDIEPGDDDTIGALVTNCPSGETYVVVNMDENDLDNAENPEGNADAEVTLTVRGTAPVVSTIEARADEQAVFACGGGFVGEAAAAIEVR